MTSIIRLRKRWQNLDAKIHAPVLLDLLLVAKKRLNAQQALHFITFPQLV